MADPRGFLKHARENTRYRDVRERVADWRHVQRDFPREKTREQAARCMDCGIPFCNDGCPLGNIIPDFNDLVFRDKWEDALARLHSTNNFPEFTGMVCPAPCEKACILAINEEPVAIKQVEWELVRRGWEEGHIAAVTNFVIMPLSFLSGTFYSVERLPENWRFIADFNPFFYLIDGFRYGFIGHADGSLAVGAVVVLVVNAALWALTHRMFAVGYRLKP